MSWYVVSYDIRTTNDPKIVLRIEEELRKNSDWCMPMLSHWVIQSAKSPVQIMDHLKKSGAMHEMDSCFIFETTMKGAFQHANKHASEWLQQKLQIA
jgi:hypothetical protein